MLNVDIVYYVFLYIILSNTKNVYDHSEIGLPDFCWMYLCVGDFL
jgi:hypothetical protein